jgi:GT2 family glycosyltransferase
MASTGHSFDAIGLVAIGRNEGERLLRCLTSAAASSPIVYVDSGSTDGSPERAAALNADVVQLPKDRPFTAGRARNFGFARLLSIAPSIRYVQFVDGDCEIAAGWLQAAAEFLEAHEDVAIVCGRRREQYPEASIYNRILDMEWDRPSGYTEACGGDFLVRSDVFRQSGGFTDALIAGEEPELCYRIRKLGWKIYRLPLPMTHHDAAITRARQWMRRTARAGYAYAARAALHRRDGNRYCWRENLRIVVWALFLPALAMVGALLVTPWSLALLLVFPLQFLRVARSTLKRHPHASPFAYSFFTLLGRWPELYGQLMWLARALQGREETIIEYK